MQCSKDVASAAVARWADRPSLLTLCSAGWWLPWSTPLGPGRSRWGTRGRRAAAAGEPPACLLRARERNLLHDPCPPFSPGRFPLKKAAHGANLERRGWAARSAAAAAVGLAAAASCAAARDGGVWTGTGQRRLGSTQTNPMASGTRVFQSLFYLCFCIYSTFILIFGLQIVTCSSWHLILI